MQTVLSGLILLLAGCFLLKLYSARKHREVMRRYRLHAMHNEWEGENL